MEPLLTGSVGRNGTNNPQDVTLVQQGLNALPLEQGRPAKSLVVDGKCGEKTIAAIQGFQLHHFGWKLADGRIDQLGRTWGLLSSLIALFAPILLQATPPPPARRVLRIWLKNRLGSSYQSAFNYGAMNTITFDLFHLFNRVLPYSQQFQVGPDINWQPAAPLDPLDILVYFVSEPKYGLLPDLNARPDAGGHTGFIGNHLVMQVYCVEQSQRVLRPGEYLAKLAFHEMMHGKLDVGPTPPGRDPTTNAVIRDIHSQGGGGLAQIPTPPWAELSTRNRDLMAHNLHLPVNMYTGGL